eukprot:CAMPEP_0176136040 /NCGR_PEP_ID=MMETSP0120_2-20121206/69028_1 /TAXON_ID=160619 /ORGANISM="Kryptoperidinium foliaceum, Strain CCMP 1326" /LENGTH=58 /DNA_ID=CAMNT_0017471789 /DNA_START=40 /DNA_END=213 /DNA_ORIENTATION=-
MADPATEAPLRIKPAEQLLLASDTPWRASASMHLRPPRPYELGRGYGTHARTRHMYNP